MQIELLREKPTAGIVSEVCFDPSPRTNTWVCFKDDDVAQWVGIFGNGPAAFFSSAVGLPDDQGRTALVIAGGQGYLVDSMNRGLVRKTKWSYSYSAVAVPGRDFIVVANTTDIWAVYRDRDVYAVSDNGEGGVEDRETIALDGIVFDEPTTELLRGKLWMHDGWHDFNLNLDSLHVAVGRRVAGHKKDFQATPARGGYPYSNEYYHWMQGFWL